MNKYREIQLPTAFVEASRSPEKVDGIFRGGIDFSQGAQELEFDKSPDLDQVRAFRGGLTQAEAHANLGLPAGSRIVALGEHRFIQAGGEIFTKIFRVFPTEGDGFARLESWDGAGWALEVESDSIVITNANLAWKSIHNIVFFAKDNQGRVFKWDNSNLEENAGNNFASGNKMGGYTGSSLISTVVTPAEAEGNQYKAHYSLFIAGPTLNEGEIVIAVLRAGVEITTKTRKVPVSTDPTRTITHAHEEILFNTPITDGDLLSLQIKTTGATPLLNYNQQLTRDVSNIEALGDNPGYKSVGEAYTFDFHLNDVLTSGLTAQIGFYVTYDGMAYVQLDEQPFDHGRHQHTVTVSQRPLGFRILIEGESDDTDWSFNDPVPVDTEVYVNRAETLLFEIHGFNDGAPDNDPTKGVTYSTTGDIINDLVLVEKDVSEYLFGTQLGVFANRLLVLRQGGDAQNLAWSANGFPSDFISEGSGESLLGSDSDPIDELRAFGRISSDVGALFRRQSIMRVVRTGRLEPALAFFPWIEELGTESPFCIIVVPGGLIFVGNDRQIYYLTESGPQPIGLPIFEFFRNLDEDQLEFIEGIYDPINKEVMISVPGEGEEE